MSNSEIVLGTFRSIATASVAARWHCFGKSDAFQKIAGHARTAGGTPSSFPTAAGSMAMAVAENAFSRLPELKGGRRDLSAHVAAQTVLSVSLGFLVAYDRQSVEQIQHSKDQNRLTDRELAEAEQTVWHATWNDVQLLKDGVEAASLMTRPLWEITAFEPALDSWRNLSARLVGHDDENWKCWTVWYEAMLNGSALLSESSETARVSLSNDVWDQGPAIANTHIAGL